MEARRMGRRVNRDASRISREIQAKVWEDVRRKLTSVSANELQDYAHARAVQLAHPYVEALLAKDAGLTGGYGNSVIAAVSTQAVAASMMAAKKSRRNVK
jgi:hypothetical protein